MRDLITAKERVNFRRENRVIKFIKKYFLRSKSWHYVA